MSLQINLRAATRTDEPFLWEMLYYAAHMHDEPGKTVQDAMQDAFLVKYVRDWGRPGDMGFIAVEQSTNTPIGAAWVRLYTSDSNPYSQVDESIPELAVAVLPGYVGQGVGTQLMQHLLAQAKGVYPAIALSVRVENPAYRLYQRLGFQVVAEIVNRVGTKSVEMRYRFDGR